MVELSSDNVLTFKEKKESFDHSNHISHRNNCTDFMVWHFSWHL